MIDINDNLLWLLIGTFTALCGGTLVRIVALRNAVPELVRKRMGSLKVWWILTILMSLAVVFGRCGAAVLLAIASGLGLREYLKLIGTERIGKAAMVVAFVSMFLQYALIAAGLSDESRIVLPVFALLLLSTSRLLPGKTEDFIRTTAGVYWGVMLLVYCLSHAVLLFTLPFEHKPLVGLAGWLLFVVIVTEMDDIAQALVGRAVGRRKIVPAVSPNKTWEGFAGGVVTSIVLSLLLAPWLTTFPSVSTVRGFLVAVAAGLLIVVAAFLGDINMSAIKRDVGVKDGSSILPGMGGVIDRIDSLTFTAPAFYYFLIVVL
jgi:phosphatidate cytidylyltransferase